MFKTGIVRPPGRNFADGLTTSEGPPDYPRALDQHGEYCTALEYCGLTVLLLPPDLAYPDSTFVEDVSIATPSFAILTRPGAKSRAGEIETIREPIGRFFQTIHEIETPGTLDGGDVCQAGTHFFTGISQRTNEDGAKQLASFLSREGYTSSFVDIRGMKNTLHLKSDVAYLGDNQLLVSQAMAARKEFRGYDLIRVLPEEGYAANCVRVNDYVLVPDGFPRLEGELTRRGLKILLLAVSEFRKMDGGLSCLSLRF